MKKITLWFPVFFAFVGMLGVALGHNIEGLLWIIIAILFHIGNLVAEGLKI